MALADPDNMDPGDNVVISADNDFDEDLSALDRGDTLLDSEPAPVPAPEPAPIVDPEPAPAPALAADPEPVEPEPAPEPVEPEPSPTSRTIPYDRFQQVNEERKRLKQQLEERDRQAQAAQAAAQNTFDFDAKESEYMELMLDGKTAEALAVRREIRAAEASQYEAQAVAKATEAASSARMEAEQATVIAEANRRYPIFDPDSAEYNEELTLEAIALINAYQNGPQQLDFGPAVARMVDTMTKLHGIVDVTAPPAPPAAPPVSATPPAPNPAAVQRKVDAAAAQPPVASGIVPDAPAQSIDSMTDEELAALPKATLARMRGDTL